MNVTFNVVGIKVILQKRNIRVRRHDNKAFELNRDVLKETCFQKNLETP